VLVREARLAVLDAMKAAESKVLRIFISYTPANNKNTGKSETSSRKGMITGLRILQVASRCPT